MNNLPALTGDKYLSFVTIVSRGKNDEYPIEITISYRPHDDGKYMIGTTTLNLPGDGHNHHQRNDYAEFVTILKEYGVTEQSQWVSKVCPQEWYVSCSVYANGYKYYYVVNDLYFEESDIVEFVTPSHDEAWIIMKQLNDDFKIEWDNRDK